jgi:hypothetical protein
VLRRDGRRAHHDLGAVGLEGVALVLAHLVGADEHALVAPALGDHGQADAGVAAGRLHDRASGPQLAGLLGRFDHPQRDPVLHTATGVEVLDLREHRGRHPVGQRVQLDQRRVADQIDDVFDVLHPALLSK